MPEETRQKISAAQTGEKNHFYGEQHTAEWKRRQREFTLANGIKPPVRSGPMSEAQKAAIGAGNRGKKRTPEQSAYLSQIRKGKKRKSHSLETIENVGDHCTIRNAYPTADASY